MTKKRNEKTDELLDAGLHGPESDKASSIEDLRVSELTYRRLFEAAPDGILILDGETGQIMDANPYLENLLQYPRREFLDMKIWEFAPFGKTAINMATLKEGLQYNQNDTLQLETRDGRKIDVEFVSNTYLVNDRKVIQCKIRDATLRKREDKSLEEPEARLRNTSEVLPTLIVFIDKQQRYRFANQSFKSWFGISASDVIGKTIREITAHRSYEIIEDNIDLILSGRNMIHKDLIQLADGRTIHYEANFSPQTADGDESEGCCILIRDITEQKTLEDRLREAKYHLEWLVSDRTAKIMEMNRQLLREIEERKKTTEAFKTANENHMRIVHDIGVGAALINARMEIMALNDQMKKWFPHIDPSQQPICFKSFNVPGRDGICSYCPTRRTFQDGQIHEAITETPRGDTIVHYRVITAPIKDKYGHITEVLELVDDATHTESDQERPIPFEDNSQAIFETTGNATVIIEEDTTIILANRAFLKRFGYTKMEMEGERRLTDLVLTEDLGRFRKHYLRGINSSESVECRFRDRNQNKMVMIMTISTIPGTTQKVVSLCDITEQKRLEDVLNEKDRELQSKTNKLDEINTALAVLLKRRESDNMEMEEKILANVNDLIRPYLDKLSKGRLDASQRGYVHLIEDNISNIVSPFLHHFSKKYPNLTPQEIQVATMIKNGKTSKEMAVLLNISERTVNFHREHIRRKLGLANKKVNLRSHLLSMA